ncbi:MAG: outer membrane beta-barrel protein [Planctomycetota bacterium]
MRRLAPFALLLATPLVAQRFERPFFRGGVGFAGGQYGFDSSQGGFDDRTDAGLFLAEFEGTSRYGYGGGFRFEREITRNDDGLFRTNDPFDEGTEARNATFFGHFTYRIAEHRFAMPIRIGLLFHSLTLEDTNNVDPDATYSTLGPYFEIEPEFTMVRSRHFRWSLYGLFGAGVGGTAIDIDGDARDYTSSTGFLSVEAGTRMSFGPAELGVAFVGRYRSMDDSEVEFGQFVFGYDDDFQGLLVTLGVRF